VSMWPQGNVEQRVAILEDRINKVEIALVEAYANNEPANIAICKQRLDELADELDRLIPQQRSGD